MSPSISSVATSASEVSEPNFFIIIIYSESDYADFCFVIIIIIIVVCTVVRAESTVLYVHAL